MTKLREMYKRDLEIKGFSPKTQQAYLRHVVAFSRYFGSLRICLVLRRLRIIFNTSSM